MRDRALASMLLPLVVAAACAPAGDTRPSPSVPAASADTLAPLGSFHDCDRLTLGAPVAVCLGFNGVAVLADASPPRLVSYDPGAGACQEFQAPADRPAFRASDVSVRGFFVYAVDEANRLLLRWDASGTYRDVLLNFEDLAPRRRVSPYGLDVDASGRVAISDVENHQILVLDTYLEVDVTFGNYGSFAGQLDTPQGVSFTPGGELLVADSGNARLQVFSDAGAFRRVIPAEGAENPMRRPRRAAALPDGRVFVADPLARRVFEFAPDGRCTRAIVPAGRAVFEPTDVAPGPDGSLYVTDAAAQALHTLQVM
jgi:DNA-binding beta-propeller fold protein YncE